MFMILQMEDGGIDVESFVFNSAYQALFAFLQVYAVLMYSLILCLLLTFGFYYFRLFLH